MLTYSYLRDLSESNDPDILYAIDHYLENRLTAIINRKQDYFNALLKIGKYVTLGEVYTSLGLETTAIDLAIGWKIDSENGDGFIDLGYRVIERENGSKLYRICPNVDGFILTTIK